MKVEELFIIVAVLLIWSSNVLVQKDLAGQVPLLILNFLRFSLIIPFIFVVKRPAGPLLPYFITAFFWNILNFLCQGYGWKAGVEASISSYVIQTSVFFSILFSFLILKRKTCFNQIIGMCISFIGILVLAWKVEPIYTMWTKGLIFLILSAASNGLGFTLVQKYKFPDIFSASIWLSTASFIMLLPLVLFIEGPFKIWQTASSLSWFQLGEISYGSLLSNVVAIAFWISLTKKHTPGALMPFLLLIPVITTFLSYFFLNETLNYKGGSACALIMLGVIMAQFTSFKQFLWVLKRLSYKTD